MLTKLFEQYDMRDSRTGSALEHISPSHINDFLERRPMWYLKRIAYPGVLQGGSVQMVIGQFIDKALGEILPGEHQDPHSFWKNVISDFAIKAMRFENDADKVAKACDKLLPLANEAMEVMLEIGECIDYQPSFVAVESNLDIPIIGYGDFILRDSKGEMHLVELKCPGRISNEPSSQHLRQVSFYAKANQQAAEIGDDELIKHYHILQVWCGAKGDTKHVLHTLTSQEIEANYKALIWGAQAMADYLKLVNGDIDKLATLCTPETDSWMLNDPESLEYAKKVWPKLLANKKSA